MIDRFEEWAESRRPESGGFVGVTEKGKSEIDTQTLLLSIVPAGFGMYFYTKFGAMYGLVAAFALVLIEGGIYRALRYLVLSKTE